ncbi:tRNA (adenine(22)-N(1))-methyltransferase [Marinicrinis lubricantis]|uniref:tRNA (Adenine(22)-N(1))-methyltransferase n=1 Tax=Marinicrinis lubricantis TaxID=2086470 RepID=A0ABW1IUR1_9BACL
MNIQISERLKKIASFVPEGSVLADIGSDHALLPIFLAAQEQIASAIAGEVNEGPYRASCQNVRQHGLGKVIDVRLGNGLSVVQQGEASCITIAGMGGSLICTILEEGKDKLKGVQRLVLQPNVGEEQVRIWLLKNGWYLEHETILEEDQKIYEILIARPAISADELRLNYPVTATLSHQLTLTKEELLLFGPYLVREHSEVFLNKWAGELRKLGRVMDNMANSASAESIEKRKRFEEHYKRLKEVWTCLQKEQPSSNYSKNGSPSL